MLLHSSVGRERLATASWGAARWCPPPRLVEPPAVATVAEEGRAGRGHGDADASRLAALVVARPRRGGAVGAWAGGDHHTGGGRHSGGGRIGHGAGAEEGAQPMAEEVTVSSEGKAEGEGGATEGNNAAATADVHDLGAAVVMVSAGEDAAILEVSGAPAATDRSAAAQGDCV